MVNFKSKKTLVGILSILIIIIGALGFFVGSRIIRDAKSQSFLNEIQSGDVWNIELISDTVRANVVRTAILNKLESDPNYTFQNANYDYEYFQKHTQGDLKIYLTINHGLFYYKQTGDLNEALEILNIESELTEITKIDYYYAMVELYTLAEDEQNAKKYLGLIEEILSEEINVEIIDINETRSEE